MEERAGSTYIKTAGVIAETKSGKVEYFHCSRGGVHKSKATGKRRPKISGEIFYI